MKLKVNSRLCKGCNICVSFCPKNVLSLDELGKVKIINETACVHCGQCELRCPDFAICLIEREGE